MNTCPDGGCQQAASPRERTMHVKQPHWLAGARARTWLYTCIAKALSPGLAGGRPARAQVEVNGSRLGGGARQQDQPGAVALPGARARRPTARICMSRKGGQPIHSDSLFPLNERCACALRANLAFSWTGSNTGTLSGRVKRTGLHPPQKVHGLKESVIPL